MTFKSPLAKTVARRLDKRDYDFEIECVQSGDQFRFSQGAVLTIFHTETFLWQGKGFNDRPQIDKMIERVLKQRRKKERQKRLAK